MVKQPSSQQKNKKLNTDEIVDSVVRENALFYDQYKTPYIAVGGKGSALFDIESKEFKRWIGNDTYRRQGTILKGTQLKNIVDALQGIALFSGKGEIKLEPRVQYIDGVIWYDLGGSAVRIDKKGWEIIEDPPILFHSHPHQEKQVIPERGGDVQSLRQFVNMQSDYDWILFLTFAIASFIPDFPKPTLILNGVQGSGKSTPMKMLKRLIDPSILLSCGAPKSSDELARMASKHILLLFDNLSKIPGKVSDDLCRLITGDAFVTRTFYTNNGDTIFRSKRAIMMNGIVPFIQRADLLDRAIILDLKPIKKMDRMPEDELWAKFDAERPKILGAIFTILSGALEWKPRIQTHELPRMGDFAKWGYAINAAIGETTGEEYGDGLAQANFWSAYTRNEEHRTEEALLANPVAVAAMQLVEEEEYWRGTATDFFDEFVNPIHSTKDRKYIKDSPMWPEDPVGVGRALVRAESNLAAVNIKVEHYRENNQRKIWISRGKRLESGMAYFDRAAAKDPVFQRQIEKDDSRRLKELTKRKHYREEKQKEQLKLSTQNSMESKDE